MKPNTQLRVGLPPSLPSKSDLAGQGGLRDLEGHVLRQYLESGGIWTWKEDYVWGPTCLLATVSPTEGTKHHVTDHLGSPRLVCDRGAHTLARHDYYPYGEESTFAYRDRERIKFTGQERDLGLDGQTTDDLDYMHARYYTFHLGRFLSVDPVGGRVGSSQSWNRYAYALSNPLRYTDPWGLDEEDINGRTGGCDQDSAAGDQVCTSRRPPGENSVASEASLQVASRKEERGDHHVWTKENSTGTHQALASLGTLSEEYGLFSIQWKEDFISGRYWGTALGEEALQGYVTTLIDPSAPWYAKAAAGAGGFFASLWTRATYLKTYTVLLGGAGAGRWMAVHQPEVTVLSKGNVLKILSRPRQWGFRIDPAHHGKPWGHIHFWRW